jgi:hypothetical protein
MRMMPIIAEMIVIWASRSDVVRVRSFTRCDWQRAPEVPFAVDYSSGGLDLKGQTKSI